MHKFLFSIIAGLLILSVPGLVFADATVTTASNARTASYANGILTVSGIADLSSGNTAEIDGAGALSVMEYPKTIAQATGGTLNTGTALVGSACRVSNIIVSGPTTAAGNYVLIYDAASAAGTAKFDISVGTAKGTTPIVIPGGATFSTGVFADSNSDNVHLTITYDN